MLTIKKLPLAEQDLINIWIYGCETFGVVQADRYLDSIETVLIQLTHSPEVHRLRDDLHPPVRFCHHASHLIIYTIESDAIIIIRVLHQSMDVERHL